MTLILTFITAHLGTLLAIGGGAVALVTAWLHGKSRGAAQQATKTQAVQQQLSQQQAAAAQAQTSAVQDGAQAAAAALPPGGAQAELQANWKG